MKKKSDLLGIDLQEELTAIRAHRAGKKRLKTKKLKAPSNAAMIRPTALSRCMTHAT